MTPLNRRALFAGASLLAAGLTGPALAQSQASIELVVPVAPPAPRVEVIPEIPSDRRDVEYWQPGYWRWNGTAHEWHEGRYVTRPRAGAVWIPGHWDRKGQGWIYVEGHWS